jgi:serine/threonine protein kinase
MISETGGLQIIDFGIAGILQSNLDVDKRKTVIGTPHWMPPELQKNAQEVAEGYGFEVMWSRLNVPSFQCARD